MPTPEEILASLEAIANSAMALATLWHVAALGVVVALGLGWRPSRRVFGVLLAMPCVSVSALAWVHGNPFNGLVFAVLSLLLVVIALRMPRQALRVAHPLFVLTGGAIVLYGLVYPHFLSAEPWYTYLYAAPTGLVPCPTLSLMIGASIACCGLGSRAWAWTLVLFGGFYGLFGMARLGVMLDLGLVLASAALLIFALTGASKACVADKPEGEKARPPPPPDCLLDGQFPRPFGSVHFYLFERA